MFTTRSVFRGELDTSGGTADPQLMEALQSLVRFEIRASLPGQTVIDAGMGTVDGGVAVWHPPLGERAVLQAEARAMRTGMIVGVVLPLLLLVSALAWFFLGRRSPQIRDEIEEQQPGILQVRTPDSESPDEPAGV